MSRGSEYPGGRRRDDPPPEQEESEDATFADVLNSFSFDSGRKQRKRRKQRAQDEDVSRGHPPPREGAQGAHQAAGDPDDDFDRDWPRDIPTTPRRQPSVAPDASAEGAEDAQASSIRSYTWTGGRTKSNYQLEMETLVSTSESYRPGAMVRMEHQSIAEMCHHPRSVAEVGALLGVPIGVARVLLADMAELGLITVHQTVSESGSAPHLMLMERVLSGLRRL
jgi:hypothetical protein